MNLFLVKIKKIVSSLLIVAMFQMILSPLFLNQTFAAAPFTDDVSSLPVQSDIIQIDVT